MNTDNPDKLRTLIFEPAQNVMSQPLRAVYYYVLKFDAPDFNLDQPNVNTCQTIYLEFAQGELELDWGFENALRDDEIVYHLIARSFSERQATMEQWLPQEEYAGLARLEAGQARHWKRVLGEPLLGFDVWAIPLKDGRYSPQAMTLRFPSEAITVAIGMSGMHFDPPVVGDGDEVLVFDSMEWKAQTERYARHLLRFDDVETRK